MVTFTVGGLSVINAVAGAAVHGGGAAWAFACHLPRNGSCAHTASQCWRLGLLAGAYAEDLPLICITGGPNSNDFASNRLLHHTLGKKFDFLQEYEAFKQVTCEQVGAH